MLEAFDRAVDRAVDPLRGNSVVDVVSYSSSALGDHGLVWFLIGVADFRKPDRRRRSLRAVAFTGLVTPIVNRGVKAVTQRARPDDEARHLLPLRIPSTTSFPSGHALAAWCAAVLFAEEDPLAPIYFAIAALISVSRIHVRLHHATDVLGGSLLGVALGYAGRRVVPLHS